ncbi:MAG: transketolase [Candidatus Roizmanbacteria bacterium]|nr:transketolase [Candidatus Roizmanbacteria bacterium]
MNNIGDIAVLLRRAILESTTSAGSGHPTSSLSAVELMAVLFFGGFYQCDIRNPDREENDRMVFSKGHAAPLLYALYHLAGVISHNELLTLRDFSSNLEGHPSMRFPFIEAATGSLGQGLSVGLGIALTQKKAKTYVLLGDSELAEGQVWEAAMWAGYRRVDTIVAIIDVNRLGQRGETMVGWRLQEYETRFAAFGWHTIVVADGHDVDTVRKAYREAATIKHKPTVIIAKTVKGKGVSVFENQEGWHGKPLSKKELFMALRELPIPAGARETYDISMPPEQAQTHVVHSSLVTPHSPYALNKELAPRYAFGEALVALGKEAHDVVVFDAEVSNSTYTTMFGHEYSTRFYEMFIAEQNMISVASGMATRGKVPVVATFAAFLTRAFDQLRMANYSNTSLIVAGTHVGVSIGEDGPSQMGLEDIAMMRSLPGSTVVYPADATASYKLLFELYGQQGIRYMRLGRSKVPVLYDFDIEFPLGGFHTWGDTEKTNDVLIIAAGITLHEALKAQKELLDVHHVRALVIDLYSIEPMDEVGLIAYARSVKYVLTVEDHYPAGGIGEAVSRRLVNIPTPVYSLAVNKTPRSGSSATLLEYEGIDARAIIHEITSLLHSKHGA